MEQWRKDARKEPIIIDIDSLVPAEHLLRKIEKVMDYEWLYERLDGLTVEVMEKIIARQPNAEVLKKEYDEFVAFWGKEVKDKKTGKMVMRAPYGKTKSWFLKKVPNYQSIDFSQKVEANQSEEQTPATENVAEQANVN